MSTSSPSPFRAGWVDPPRGCSLMPFWFWNDALDEREIGRQLADFRAHGVYGVVIHPRVGLPREIGWMSERMLGFVRFAVDEAARHGMLVVLYDEGMYPSGSSNGQVVAENPVYQCRGLARVKLGEREETTLAPGQNLVAVLRDAGGTRYAIVDRPVDSVIRGLHYEGEVEREDREQSPPAADLLNPDATACFIRLVYDRYFAAVGEHFGKTVIGIFTDEPDLLGRLRERDADGGRPVRPGTSGILDHVNRFVGYDCAPHLLALWEESPVTARYRADYARALHARLEETYYAPLKRWCDAHGVALMGHPAEADDIGLQRYFTFPGQDLVWRWVMPDEPTALEGPQSTQAKCSSSAMTHLRRRRNSNEFCGAYGHALTFAQMKWLADWCFVRGVNLLIPHAFYYSVRGIRRDERPPDVGPNSPWWADYRRTFADYCRRICWVNTDSTHVCSVAILGRPNHLPWSAARALFRHQRDFNYVEDRHFAEDAKAGGDGIDLAGMHYDVLVIDGDADPSALADRPAPARAAVEALAKAGRCVVWRPVGGTALPAGAVAADDEVSFIAAIDRLVPIDVALDVPHPDLRVRHVIKNSRHVYLLHNEGRERFERKIALAAASAGAVLLNPHDSSERPLPADGRLSFGPYEMHVVAGSDR